MQTLVPNKWQMVNLHIINMNVEILILYKSWIIAWIPPFSLFYPSPTRCYKGVWVHLRSIAWEVLLRVSLYFFKFYICADMRILAGAWMTKEVHFLWEKSFSNGFCQHPLHNDIVMQYHLSYGSKDFMLW